MSVLFLILTVSPLYQKATYSFYSMFQIPTLHNFSLYQIIEHPLTPNEMRLILSDNPFSTLSMLTNRYGG